MGPYFRGVIIFVVIPHTSYSRILHSLTNLSLISNFIHAIKGDANMQNQSSLHIIGLRLNMETNKLESIVNSNGKNMLLLRFCC